MKTLEIAACFDTAAEPVTFKELGNGHINSTFLITDKSSSRYVLQKINKTVFKKPRELMFNLMQVTDFLKCKTDDARAFLHFSKTKAEGVPYFVDNAGDFWRMYGFVENSLCVERPTVEEFTECGKAFGNFAALLSDFVASVLFETIPDFHNTPKRYDNLMAAVKDDEVKRAASVQKEIKFFKKRKDYYSLLLDANESGKLPLRVCHNDTKCNNVLLDTDTKKGLCVIDLDTIMPGFYVTDFGDAVRFGASTAAEDEPDTEKVALNTEYFKAYAKGYIEGTGGKLKKSEADLLYDGAVMMTLECGMRFLTDYLCGDVYFKTDYETHNLVRARTQIALVEDMEKRRAEMTEFIKSLG